MGDADFERDAISFILELGQKCGLKPQDAFPRLGGMRHRLSELRAQWVAELDTVLAHAMRDRDAYKARAETQATAISLAAMALDDWRKSGSVQSITQAKAFLEAALPFKVDNGPETQGEKTR